MFQMRKDSRQYILHIHVHVCCFENEKRQVAVMSAHVQSPNDLYFKNYHAKIITTESRTYSNIDIIDPLNDN